MDETKLTVRISRDLVENAKAYAAQNHTTLTAINRIVPSAAPGSASIRKCAHCTQAEWVIVSKCNHPGLQGSSQVKIWPVNLRS